MSIDVTVSLPENVWRHAELWAQRLGRPVGDFLAESIERSLLPLGSPRDEPHPPESWSEEEVLAAVDTQMAPEDDARLSDLLYRQQAGLLTGSEPTELTALMQTYQHGLLRKAQALREAVRRGLREPFQP